MQFDQFIELKYVVVDNEATELPRYYGEDISFDSFNSMVSGEYAELVWSTMSVAKVGPNFSIAITNSVKYFFYCGAYSNLLQPPSVDRVIENLIHFTTKVAPDCWTNDLIRSSALVATVEPIYRYLCYNMPKQPKSSTIPSPWKALLDTHWILVDFENEPVFARPCDVFFEMYLSFKGYLYKAPFQEYRK